MQKTKALAKPDHIGTSLLPLSSATHQQSGSRTGYIGVADAARILRRRRWLIIFILFGAVLAALLFLSRAPAVYSTTTTVVVQPSDQSLAAAVPTMKSSESEEAAIQTKVELFQSRPLARQVVRSLHLEDDTEFSPPPGSPGLVDWALSLVSPSSPVSADPKERAEADERARSEAVIDNLIDHVSVQRVARSNVISITASSTDPVKAARIANRLVDIYIRNQIDGAEKNRTDEIAALSSRVADFRANLEVADAAAAAYRRQHGLLSSQPEAAGNAQAIALTGMLAQAQGDSASDARRAAPVVVAGGALSATSALLTDLRQQETMLTRKMSQLSSFYGPGYPEIAQTSAELAALRGRIGQENARITADLQSQASASRAKSGSIGAVAGMVRSQSLSQGQAAVALRALEREVDAASNSYMTLLGQLNTKIASPLDDEADISRISRAPVPNDPSYPLPKRVLSVVAAAAVAMGMLLAFLMETMDTKLRTSEQVQRLLGMPTLAMIPEVEDEQAPIYSAVAGRPRSRFAEAMRNLLIEVESRTADLDSRVIVVTSPLQGEGKNTVATSLAAAAAVIGRHVVVVDFDLRRPGTESEGLSMSTGVGVVAYLAERALVDDLVVGQEGGFTVIGVEENAADPGALIVSPRLPQLLAQLRERFELVILNAPPILPVRDAKTLADHADAALLVLRWGRTSPEAAATAMEIFGRPITGAVLNRVDYAVHADRHYGDAIHHVAQAANYYEQEARPGRFFRITRLIRRLRRSVGLAT